jgi:hypothetical protein
MSSRHCRECGSRDQLVIMPRGQGGRRMCHPCLAVLRQEQGLDSLPDPEPDKPYEVRPIKVVRGGLPGLGRRQ